MPNSRDDRVKINKQTANSRPLRHSISSVDSQILLEYYLLRQSRVEAAHSQPSFYGLAQSPIEQLKEAHSVQSWYRTFGCLDA